jgi:hypothetical protein
MLYELVSTFHYGVQKSSPLDQTPGRMNPVCIVTPYLSEIHSNIILLCLPSDFTTSRAFQSISLIHIPRFSHARCVQTISSFLI